MIVYVEDCLIENFVVTFLILKCVCLCFKLKLNKIKIIFACLFASTVSVLYPLVQINNVLLVVLKLSVGFIIVAIAFDKNNIVAKYITFVFFTALYAGLNILFYYFLYGSLEVYDNFPTYVLLGLLLLIYFLTKQCICLARKKLTISNFVYKVKIKHQGKTIEASAFLDSGNTLTDNDSAPVFIINSKLFNKLYKNISISDLLTKNFKNLSNPHYIKSGFASGSGKILVFSVDSVEIIEINNVKKFEITNAKLGISYSNFNKNFNCDMLLNINMFV